MSTTSWPISTLRSLFHRRIERAPVWGPSVKGFDEGTNVEVVNETSEDEESLDLRRGGKNDQLAPQRLHSLVFCHKDRESAGIHEVQSGKVHGDMPYLLFGEFSQLQGKLRCGRQVQLAVKEY